MTDDAEGIWIFPSVHSKCVEQRMVANDIVGGWLLQ